MATCEKFCTGPENTNRGINCQLDVFDKRVKVLKHNPKTKQAALNLIRNGGRHQICLWNPWRYMDIQPTIQPDRWKDAAG